MLMVAPLFNKHASVVQQSATLQQSGSTLIKLVQRGSFLKKRLRQPRNLARVRPIFHVQAPTYLLFGGGRAERARKLLYPLQDAPCFPAFPAREKCRVAHLVLAR